MHLLSSWINRSSLVLKRIEWSTAAHVLEKIIRYEAVHAIASWDDLRLRLEPSDRRCFAFFHARLADEPLIFVEVALTRDIPSAIAPLLAADRRPIRSDLATTAVFYSISTCQAGLKGISLGNFLINRVADELKRELPSLKTFVTLSPVPGFTQWLRRERASEVSAILSREDKAALSVMDYPDWAEHAPALKAIRPILVSGVVHYLLHAKGDALKPVDPVERFHLGNGARLERVNWLGDVTPKGLSEAAGFMVNYLYDFPQVERNHELFANSGKVVASVSVRRLARSAALRGV
jgi:malonyl-CoA decarboxylase